MRWWLLTIAVILTSIGALAHVAWSSLPPISRYYLQPEAEAELVRLLPPVSILGHLLYVPQVAILLRSQGAGWRWFTLPPEQIHASLAPVYPTPLATLACRVLVVALIQSVVVLVAVWIGLRAAVRTIRRASQAPVSSTR
jgi:hypothetical protein